MIRVRRPGLVAAVALLGCCLASAAPAQDTPTPTSTPVASPTPTSTPAPTVSPTPTFARTPTVATAEVGGSYAGTWASAGAAGAISLTLASGGEGLSGTAIFQDHPCLGFARFSGRVSGNAVNGTLTSLTSAVTGNTRLTANPAGLVGTFSFLVGCAESANGTIAVFGTAAGTPRGTATATPTGPAVTPTPSPSPSPSPTPGAVGDCDGDGSVSVDEIVRMVSIALGTRPLSFCPAGDSGGDGKVTVDEILQAVFIALSGITTTVPPPPLVERCLALGTEDCVCRDSVCCIVGRCGEGEPCRASADCTAGLRCIAADGGAVCTSGGTIVVPPPR